VDIICFDEFFVDDITDAMILAGMFDALFKQGVVLMATSNIHPENLYKNGLQGPRFLPAIDLIMTHCDVYHLDGGTDYRLGRLLNTDMYCTPLNSKTNKIGDCFFNEVATGSKQSGKEITILTRNIKTVATSVDTLMIDFARLCDGPRSVRDYIEIAILYRTVFITERAANE